MSPGVSLRTSAFRWRAATTSSPTSLQWETPGPSCRAWTRCTPAVNATGQRSILSLAPGAKDFEEEALVAGCGVNDVFSIAVAPEGGFLVSGWGAPPSRASFVRLRPDGSLDESFGDDGRAETADLGVDNLFVSYPAFAQSGAFMNSLTQPREPTLRLEPSRFSASGALATGSRRRRRAPSSALRTA